MQNLKLTIVSHISRTFIIRCLQTRKHLSQNNLQTDNKKSHAFVVGLVSLVLNSNRCSDLSVNLRPIKVNFRLVPVRERAIPMFRESCNLRCGRKEERISGYEVTFQRTNYMIINVICSVNLF